MKNLSVSSSIGSELLKNMLDIFAKRCIKKVKAPERVTQENKSHILINAFFTSQFRLLFFGLGILQLHNKQKNKQVS